MASRRDLLKHFGVGAIIAPIIGGAPAVNEAARLIEVPKIEAVTAPHRTIGGLANLLTPGLGAKTIRLLVSDDRGAPLEEIAAYVNSGESVVLTGHTVQIFVVSLSGTSASSRERSTFEFKIGSTNGNGIK